MQEEADREKGLTMAKNWRVVKPRKHVKKENRIVRCLMCEREIDAERDAHVKNPQGQAWCLDCSEVILDETLNDLDHEITAVKRMLLRLAVFRKG